MKKEQRYNMSTEEFDYCDDEEEAEARDEHRYIFCVRQAFGETPCLDTFYELQVPSGLTGEQAQIMTKLDARFCKEQIQADTRAFQGMDLRIKFNPSMFQNVCLVRTVCEITADDLEKIVVQKYREGKLLDFLEESAIKP